MELRQQVRLCHASDGTRIALATLGSGAPLLRTAHWLSHLEYDVRSPVWSHWLQELSRRNTYIRYDQRGCGLSDRTPAGMSFEAWVSDLEAVVDALGLKRFDLFGMSQGGAIAIAYAARHPDKVSRLVLCGAYARGSLRRDLTPDARREAEVLLDLIRLGWGKNNPAFRQVFTSLFIPDGTPEQHQWFNDLERVSAFPQNAADIIETSYWIDVANLAAQLQVPTLIFHASEDARVPFEEGRILASLIPNARFVPLASRNHVLLSTEPAWSVFVRELHAFLDGGGSSRSHLLESSGLTASEAAVLDLMARGLANAAIARTLGKREKTVRNQVSAIFSKLQVRSRAEAIVRARDSGMGAWDGRPTATPERD
ncbi:MAG TPA: alpha/beta fold hydrolase [Pseudolabrys sp.]|nr:alpha/beta fold hydrolase [Pseudolabrys sp.]